MIRGSVPANCIVSFKTLEEFLEWCPKHDILGTKEELEDLYYTVHKKVEPKKKGV